MSAMATFSTAFAGLGRLEQANLIALAAGVLSLTARLWPEWQRNPDLSHGFFMPIIFAVLLWDARSQGPHRYLRAGPLVNAAFFLAMLGGLGALVAAGLYAAAVDWSHALVSLTLSASLALFLGAALIAFSRDSVRLIGFNWSALVAIGLWLFTAPIPPGTYTRLTLGLQLWVSENVLSALHLFGIPAVRHGNIIELANTTVGVEEACSGVRSLISCVFAGFFFSATLVRRPLARALIIGLSAPLALAMNFLRSLLLTLLSNAGIDIRGAWHDWTGFGVLGVTAAILGGLALILEHGGRTATKAPLPMSVPTGPSLMTRILAGGLAVATALTVLFVLNTNPPVQRDRPPPNLLGLMPETFDGWQVRTSNLYQFTGTLQTDHLAQRQYFRGGENNPTDITLYVAYWQPGQAPVSLVASHTPDACLPGSGWTTLPTPEARARLLVDQRPVPDAEYRLFQSGEYPQHVWFWHLYDGRPIQYRDPYSPAELLRIAWRYGFRHDGDQVFVRLSSNRPWAQIKDEPLVREFFGRLKDLGL
jgi:exosortase